MKTRVAGRRGRVPGRIDGIPKARNYLRNTIPSPIYPVDVSGGITEWGMLGNDTVGDWTFAGRQHYRMAVAAAGKIVEVWETAAALVAEYWQYEANVQGVPVAEAQDEGANIPSLLLHWYELDMIDGFGQVSLVKSEVDWAMQVFHGVYAGVTLTNEADQEFENHQPWIVSPTLQPNPNDGHCVVKVKAVAGGNDTWVTWGALQESTQSWTAAAMDDAYVIITKEDAEAANLDIAALRADLDTLVAHRGGYPNGNYTPPKVSWFNRLIHWRFMRIQC